MIYEFNILLHRKKLVTVDVLKGLLNSPNCERGIVKPNPVIVRWNGYQIEARWFSVFQPDIGWDFWRYAQGEFVLFIESDIEFIVKESDTLYVFLREQYVFGSRLE